MGARRRDGIRVHAQNLYPGKKLFQLFLHLLSAGADKAQFAAAVRAVFVRPKGKAAVMAHQPPVGAVVGEIDAATAAFISIAAFHTGDEF